MKCARAFLDVFEEDDLWAPVPYNFNTLIISIMSN